MKLEVGKIYTGCYDGKGRNSITFLVVDEYPHFYLCDVKTSYGEHYNISVNKADLLCLGENNSEFVRIIERESR